MRTDPRNLSSSRSPFLRVEGMRRIALLVFLVWFLVGLVVVGFDLGTPFGPWADFAFIAFASVVLCLFSAKFLRPKALVLLFLIYAVVSGGVEAYGAATGFLFGSYSYSGNFGPLLFGLLPLTIPLAWWVVVWPLHCVVQRVFPERKHVWVVPLLTAGLAVWADLVIEPAATIVRGYWSWESGGFYYGVPWTNFLGWFGTAFVLSVVSQFFLRNFSKSRIELAIPLMVLAATISTFFLLSLVHGKWLAVGLAAAFFAVLAMLVRRARSIRHD